MAEKLIVLISNASLKGGTYRVIANIIRGLHVDYDVMVLMLESQRSTFVYPDDVRIISLMNSLATSRSRVIRTLNTLWKIPVIARIVHAENPRAVISFNTRPNIANALAKYFYPTRSKCILSERNFNSIHYSRGLLGRALIRLMQIAYPRSDLVIANARDLAIDLHRTFKVPKNKLKVISNPLDLETIGKLCQEGVEHPWFDDDVPIILNVARLIEQKNHALLIRAFALIKEKTPCRLVILGEGLLKDELKRLAFKLGVGDEVLFLGWQENPFRYMHRARVFVLTSNYEGFPSVLIEAMACGCPVVSVDCLSGPREILSDGKYGLLVPLGDERALSQQIARILLQNNLRRNLAVLGQERAKHFGIRSIIEDYQDVL